MAEAHAVAGKQAPGDSRSAIVLLGTTEGGKDINLVRKINCSVRTIEFGSGGQLPKQLEGGFSSVAVATRVVDSYLAKVKAKEIKLDGTEHSASAKSK